MQEKIKPILKIKREAGLDLLFYKQFSSSFKLLKKDKNNLTHLVLSGLFLYLTLENYVTYAIRWLLENVNRRKNRRLIKIWYNHFEASANLSKKVGFFRDAFLNKENNLEIKRIKEFIKNFSELRNRIIHGHQLSIILSSNGEIDKTKLTELLTFSKINNYYEEFKEYMRLFHILIKKINIEELTPGIPTKEYVIEYLTFKFNE